MFTCFFHVRVDDGDDDGDDNGDDDGDDDCDIVGDNHSDTDHDHYVCFILVTVKVEIHQSTVSTDVFYTKSIIAIEPQSQDSYGLFDL